MGKLGFSYNFQKIVVLYFGKFFIIKYFNSGGVNYGQVVPVHRRALRL